MYIACETIFPWYRPNAGSRQTMPWHVDGPVSQVIGRLTSLHGRTALPGATQEMNARKHEQDEETPKGVMLSGNDIRHVIRLLELLAFSEGGTRLTRRNPSPAISRENLIAVAKFSHLVRQHRCDHFSPAMFGEPAWDVLLALYLAENNGTVPTVSSLAKAARIPLTTAIRWIDYLEEKRLIERQRSSDDGRASTVILSADGRARIEGYFADVLVRMAATRDTIADA